MDALIQVADQLGIDSSFYYLLGLMFALYLILSATYLVPFQKLLLLRKQKTALAQKGAGELDQKVEKEMLAYKEKMRALTQEISSVKKALHDDAKKQETALVSEASSKAKNLIQSAQKEMDSTKSKLTEQIAGELSQIAALIAAKVMGRSVGPNS